MLDHAHSDFPARPVHQTVFSDFCVRQSLQTFPPDRSNLNRLSITQKSEERPPPCVAVYPCDHVALWLWGYVPMWLHCDVAIFQKPRILRFQNFVVRKSLQTFQTCGTHISQYSREWRSSDLQTFVLKVVWYVLACFTRFLQWTMNPRSQFCLNRRMPNICD